MSDKPNCYQCHFRGPVPGDAHSQCSNRTAKVRFDPHAVRNGWAFWPVNFDPNWLQACDGFKDKTAQPASA